MGDKQPMMTGEYRWKTAHQQDFDEVERFLRHHEPYLVAAASRFISYIKEYRENEIPRRNQFLAGLDDNSTIQAFVFRSGMILHPFFSGYDTKKAQRIIRRLIGWPFPKKIYSVQGLERDVAITDGALEQASYSIKDQFDYYLMDLVDPVYLPPQPHGLQLVEAPNLDWVYLDRLYPLQAAYEEEEVLPSHEVFNEQHCRRGLERLLTKELVIYAEYEGLAAAKANTNATAYTYRQIGGVYVQPEFRGRGIGSFIVARLVQRIQESGFNVSLFVKKQNHAALRIYKKLGFKIIGEYRISYY